MSDTFDIEVVSVVADGTGNERATIVTTNLKIGNDMIVIPRKTTVALIIEVGGSKRTYAVVTRGYTVSQLVAILEAYANRQFELADIIIRDLNPNNVMKW